MPAVKRVAVIGAGACGLTATKACLDEGLEPVCFERADDLGGLWRFTEKVRDGQSCVMSFTVSNTTKEMSSFSDFPPPKVMRYGFCYMDSVTWILLLLLLLFLFLLLFFFSFCSSSSSAPPPPLLFLLLNFFFFFFFLLFLRLLLVVLLRGFSSSSSSSSSPPAPPPSPLLYLLLPLLFPPLLLFVSPSPLFLSPHYSLFEI